MFTEIYHSLTPSPKFIRIDSFNDFTKCWISLFPQDRLNFWRGAIKSGWVVGWLNIVSDYNVSNVGSSWQSIWTEPWVDTFRGNVGRFIEWMSMYLGDFRSNLFRGRTIIYSLYLSSIRLRSRGNSGRCARKRPPGGRQCTKPMSSCAA